MERHKQLYRVYKTRKIITIYEVEAFDEHEAETLVRSGNVLEDGYEDTVDYETVKASEC